MGAAERESSWRRSEKAILGVMHHETCLQVCKSFQIVIASDDDGNGMFGVQYAREFPHTMFHQSSIRTSTASGS